MGRTAVTCAKCGTNYNVQMYGKHSDRDYRAANWQGLCENCKAAEISDAAKDNAVSALPLTGSEKQIKWAMQIRDKAMAEVMAFVAEYRPKIKPEHLDTISPAFDRAEKMPENHPEASWWIDRRDIDWADLVKSEIKRLMTQK